MKIKFVSTDQLKQFICLQYSINKTIDDISNQVNKEYGLSLEKSTISAILCKSKIEVEDRLSRTLEIVYPFIFLNSICINQNNGSDYAFQKVIIVSGINIDGYWDILGIWLSKNSKRFYWAKVFRKIKRQNVKDIFFVFNKCGDDAEKSIIKAFPKAYLIAASEDNVDITINSCINRSSALNTQHIKKLIRFPLIKLEKYSKFYKNIIKSNLNSSEINLIRKLNLLTLSLEEKQVSKIKNWDSIIYILSKKFGSINEYI